MLNIRLSFQSFCIVNCWQAALSYLCSVELVGSHYLITELWYLEPGVEPQSWEGCGGIYRVGLTSHVFPCLPFLPCKGAGAAPREQESYVVLHPGPSPSGGLFRRGLRAALSRCHGIWACSCSSCDWCVFISGTVCDQLPHMLTGPSPLSWFLFFLSPPQYTFKNS